MKKTAALLMAFVAVNLFAMPRNHARFSRDFPLSFSQKGYAIRPALKKSALAATITRVVKDSAALYDFSRGIWVFGQGVDITYGANGILSYATITVGADSMAKREYGSDTSKILMTFDGSGKLTTEIIQIKKGAEWVNEFRILCVPFMPGFALNDSMTLLQGYPISGEGAYLADYLSIVSIRYQVWNTSSNAWSDTGSTLDFNSHFDSVITVNSGLKIVMSKIFSGGAWRIKEIDSLFLTAGKLTSAKTYGEYDTAFYTAFLFDNRGNETLESRRHWDNFLRKWGDQTTERYIHTYDNAGFVTESVCQDSSSAGWTPLSNCDKYFYGYAHDGTGRISTRTDSSWSPYSGPSKSKHYFTYQTVGIVDRPGSNSGRNGAVTVFPNGIVRLGENVRGACAVRIFTLDGRRLCTVPMHAASVSLWGYCASHNIPAGRGAYVARLVGPSGSRDGASFRIYRE